MMKRKQSGEPTQASTCPATPHRTGRLDPQNRRLGGQRFQRFGQRWFGLCALLAAFPSAAQPAEVGRITVSVEHSQPVLHWSNSIGQVYAIQTTADLGTRFWETAAILTTDAAEAVWADESLPRQATFYRVALSTNAAPFQDLQRALQRACANQGIVGASAAAVLPHHGLWLGTSGSSDGKVPIRPQTRFEIGSVTKTFTATTILKLAEEGRLNLEDTVGQWLPTLNCSNISPAITIRQLLNHRAGTYNFGDDQDFRQALFTDWSHPWPPEEALNYVKAPYFAPDTDGQYSNTGYVLLGMIIRSVTSSTVAAEMRRAVFNRAGLRSTCLGAEEAWIGELAHPHLDFNGDGAHEDLGGYSQTAILSSFWTSGAVISTAADLARFGIALFEGGLLKGASLAEMRAFQPVDVGGSDYDYGLGLMRFNVLGREHWAHSGGLFGEYAWLSYCAETGVSLATAYNYPITKTGPNLPGELLITLSTLADAEAGSRAMSPANGPIAPESTRIPLLQLPLPPGIP
jgi:D-alanyl-D-alanine carboxypeptidase